MSVNVNDICVNCQYTFIITTTSRHVAYIEVSVSDLNHIKQLLTRSQHRYTHT